MLSEGNGEITESVDGHYTDISKYNPPAQSWLKNGEMQRNNYLILKIKICFRGCHSMHLNKEMVEKLDYKGIKILVSL